MGIYLPGTICHGYEPSAGIPKKSGDVNFFSCDLTWNYPYVFYIGASKVMIPNQS